jgi:hypothetical protein
VLAVGTVCMLSGSGKLDFLEGNKLLQLFTNHSIVKSRHCVMNLGLVWLIKE